MSETLKRPAPLEGEVSKIETSLKKEEGPEVAEEFYSSLIDKREQMEEGILFGEEGSRPEELEQKWEEYLEEERPKLLERFKERIRGLSDEDLDIVGSYIDEKIKDLEEKKEKGGISLQEAMGSHILLSLTRRHERAGTEFENKLQKPVEMGLAKLEKGAAELIKTEADLQKALKKLRENKDGLIKTFKEVAELKDHQTGQLDQNVIDKIDKYLETVEEHLRKLTGLEKPTDEEEEIIVVEEDEEKAEITDITPELYEKSEEELLAWMEGEGISEAGIHQMENFLRDWQKVDTKSLADHFIDPLRKFVEKQIRENPEVRDRLNKEASYVKREGMVTQLIDEKLDRLKSEFKDKIGVALGLAKNLAEKKQREEIEKRKAKRAA